MRVVVTQKDIENGVPDRNMECPIALSLRRRLHSEDVRVYQSKFSISYLIDDVWATDVFELPSKAMNFIERFDDHQKVKPFTFEIDIDPEKYAAPKV